jgi:pimeloyl-ACP methyl ester carboxylesterase
MSGIREAIDLGIRAVIRPPRACYCVADMPSTVPVPRLGDIPRHPVTFANSRGHALVGSYYCDPCSPATKCVVYLHGNSSFQSEGVFLVPLFVPASASVFCFDFSGCGASEGAYISLGHFERDDVACAIAHLRAAFGIAQVALWGRSMGAATALMAAGENPAVACIVADSPFASFPQLLREQTANFSIPGCLSAPAIWFLARRVLERAQFDVREVVPLSVVPRCAAPLFLIHGDADELISHVHSQALKAAHGGPAELRIVPGQHMSDRPLPVLDEAMRFVGRALGVELDLDGLEAKMGAAEEHFAEFEGGVVLTGLEGFEEG